MNTYPDMKITGRIIRDSKTIGFIIMDTSGIPKHLNIKQTINYANDNRFINAEVIIKEGIKYLVGANGKNLRELPVFNISNNKNKGEGVA